VCLASGRKAFLSQHIGDLENDLAYDFYRGTIGHLERILDIRPKIIAHDLHPDYLSTAYALERKDAVRVAVQHHHAHVASCMAENSETGPAIGIACDGTGLGDDGTIWGGEILVADLSTYERKGHIETFPLPGGDSAVREAWRPAFSLLRQVLPQEYEAIVSRIFPELDEETVSVLNSMLERGINSPLTSSLGRLFDAVSALTGVKKRNTFEGQAAMSLEMAMEGRDERAYPTDVRRSGETLIIGLRGLVEELVDDVLSGVPAAETSLKFHNFVVKSFLEAATAVSEDTGIDTVVLSGGCFQNVYLVESLASGLAGTGMRVLRHSTVPPNDGGLSLGQVVIAGSRSGESRNR